MVQIQSLAAGAGRPIPSPGSRLRNVICIVATLVLSVGCTARRPDQRPNPGSVAAERAVPAPLADRAGWIHDMLAAFDALGLDPDTENVCAVVAVIEQESGFEVDPPVRNLPRIAWAEIDARAASAGVPNRVVHGVLGLTSRDGRTYAARIDTARTEHDLSDVFEDFIASVPLGTTLFADRNPIRTRGPMQVQVAFAEDFARRHRYPYRVEGTLADELFTRRGGLYFGIAHLLDYPARYPRFLYRFADFNAGQYASRNAAFQAAVTTISAVDLVPDGALLPHDGGPGYTEAALDGVSGALALDPSAIHEALLRSRSADFADTTLYRRVFARADARAGRPLPRALVPRIELQSPKITRHLTTAWYATRVDSRFQRCLRR